MVHIHNKHLSHICNVVRVLPAVKVQAHFRRVEEARDERTENYIETTFNRRLVLHLYIRPLYTQNNRVAIPNSRQMKSVFKYY